MNEDNFYTKEEVLSLLKEYQNDAISMSSSNIANQLGTITTLLSIIALFGIILGIFVTYKLNKVNQTLEQIEILKKNIEDFVLGTKSQLTDEFIKSITKHIIDKIEYEPALIDNVFGILTTFDLSILGERYYKKLLNCCNRVDVIYYKNQYKMLILQHFVKFLLKDQDFFKEYDFNFKHGFQTPEGRYLGYLPNEIRCILKDSVNVYVKDKNEYSERFKIIMDYFEQNGGLKSYREIFGKFLDDPLIESYFVSEDNKK